MNCAVEWLEQEFDKLWMLNGQETIVKIGDEKFRYIQVMGKKCPPMFIMKEQNGEVG